MSQFFILIQFYFALGLRQWAILLSLSSRLYIGVVLGLLTRTYLLPIKPLRKRKHLKYLRNSEKQSPMLFSGKINIFRKTEHIYFLGKMCLIN